MRGLKWRQQTAGKWSSMSGEPQASWAQVEEGGAQLGGLCDTGHGWNDHGRNDVGGGQGPGHASSSHRTGIVSA